MADQAPAGIAALRLLVGGVGVFGRKAGVLGTVLWVVSCRPRCSASV
jgi:hypothetical protein